LKKTGLEPKEMKKLMDFIVLSCHKATFLIEKSHTTPLSFLDRIQLKMHLTVCKKCPLYSQQSLFIEGLLKNDHINFSNTSDFKLSDKSRIIIKNAVEENYRNN